MEYTIKDGQPYLTMSDYLSDEPKRLTNYWRITWAESALPMESQPAFKTCIDGVYQVGNVRFNVEKYSSICITEDVPKPKRVKSELRWRDGWQKLTRSGWQPA